jgi:hypothetical protein
MKDGERRDLPTSHELDSSVKNDLWIGGLTRVLGKVGIRFDVGIDNVCHRGSLILVRSKDPFNEFDGMGPGQERLYTRNVTYISTYPHREGKGKRGRHGIPA